MPLQTPADVEQVNDIDTLIREGREAAERGDKATARAALRKARTLDDTRIDGLFTLAHVVGTIAERKALYERILELEPSNSQAQQELDDLIHGRINPHSTPEHRITKAPIELENRPMPKPAVIEACYRHPDRETGLHCFQCDRPICAKCVFQTPVGMICPVCRKERRSPLYEVSIIDAVKAGAVSLLAGIIGGLAAAFFGGFGLFFFFFIFIIGTAIGEAVMRIITWATRKRGPIIQSVSSVALILGTLAVRAFLPISPIPWLIFLGFSIATIIKRLK